MRVSVLGTFRIPPASLESFRPLMRKVVEASRAEAGCIAYAYAEDVLEPGLIRVSELWESRAQLEAHQAAPHMSEWRLEREKLGMTERNLTVYAMSGEAAL
jgi:quinol monooxygenase YgiN